MHSCFCSEAEIEWAEAANRFIEKVKTNWTDHRGINCRKWSKFCFHFAG